MSSATVLLFPFPSGYPYCTDENIQYRIEVVRADMLVVFLILGENIFFLTIKYDVCCSSVPFCCVWVDALYQVEKLLFLVC